MQEECKIKVTVVGSNPSSKSPDDTPFHPSTKSRRFIDDMFAGCNVELSYANIVDYKTANNKPLSKSEIKSQLDNIKSKFIEDPNIKIITFGSAASYGLELAGIEHFAMPHPSGLCRFWNDKVIAEAKIKEMLAWVKN